MDWVRIKTRCTPEQVEDVSAVMTVIDPCLVIDDSSDITENEHIYGELIDESLLKRNDASVSVYVSEEQNYAEMVSFLRDRFASLGMSVAVEVDGVKEEDWINNWKKYYHPVRIGERIVVVPEWEYENFEADCDDVVIKMDPGMAFGSGTHESTQLCAALMEKNISNGDFVIDVGTGSGILAICSIKLGAGSADALDIDPTAVKIASENVDKNDCHGKVNCRISDLLADAGEKADVLIANITADIILRMVSDIPKHVRSGGKVIMSGIIDSQCGNIIEEMERLEFEKCSELHVNGWTGLLFTKG